MIEEPPSYSAWKLYSDGLRITREEREYKSTKYFVNVFNLALKRPYKVFY